MGEMRIRRPQGRRSREELKRTLDTRAAMIQLKSALTVPLVGGDRIVGFLNLWDERVPEAFASDGSRWCWRSPSAWRSSWRTASSTSEMRERDRLAALGEMAAGLAHEIRNPLGRSRAPPSASTRRRGPVRRASSSDVIVEEVNRLNGVVTEFLDYARPLKQSFGTVDINEVVARTVRLIQNELPRR